MPRLQKFIENKARRIAAFTFAACASLMKISGNTSARRPERSMCLLGYFSTSTPRQKATWFLMFRAAGLGSG